MKRGNISSLLTAAAILVMSSCVWADDPVGAKTLKTTYEACQACKDLHQYTSYGMASNTFRIPVGKDTLVKLCGADVLMRFDARSFSYMLGIDLNLDGVIGKNEVISGSDYPKPVDLHLKGKKDGKDIELDVHLAVQNLSSQREMESTSRPTTRPAMRDVGRDRDYTPVAIDFGITPYWCRKCTIDNVVVRIFDDNADGVFAQDAVQKWGGPAVLNRTSFVSVQPIGDMIAIGQGEPIPLTKRHLIGGKLYELKVAADGSTVTYWPAPDGKSGKIDLPKIPSLKSLVIIGDQGAYDLVTCGTSEIPAGKYKFCYGLIAQGKQTMAISFDTFKEPVALEIVEGKNAPKVGPPFTFDWKPLASRGRLLIDASYWHIVGAGGESYREIQGSAWWYPRVAFMEGEKILQTVDKYSDLYKDSGVPFPKGMTDANGKVAMAANVPILGRVATTLTLKEVMANQPRDSDRE